MLIFYKSFTESKSKIKRFVKNQNQNITKFYTYIYIYIYRYIHVYIYIYIYEGYEQQPIAITQCFMS